MLCSRLARTCALIISLSLASGAHALGSAPWLPFGPDGGDARRIAVDPQNHAHLYLGTANGWIYESKNSGVNWKRLAQVGKRDDLVLDSIVVDPRNPQHLIVGAWVIDRPDGGIFLSNDGGATWINQAEMRGQSVRALAASKSDPNTLVAGSLQGIFRSTDGGQRWTRISPPDSTEIHEIQSIAIDPVDPNVIYAGTWHLPWKTTDGGAHWDNIKDGIIDDSDVFSIIVDPKSSKIVYASACSGIYKSENAGALFHKVQGIPSTARRTRVLLQDPTDQQVVFAGTTEGLFRSEDAGRTWARTTTPDVIVNDVSVDATDPKHVLIATNRGGVLSSEDGGDTFHSSNAGFSARQITALKRDINRPATLYVGVVNDKQWGGVFESDNGALNWTQHSEGLEGQDVFSLGQTPDGTIIAGTAHGLFRLEPETKAWKRMDEGVAAPAAEPAREPVRPVTALTRPPVPVGRNHFAERKSVKAQTPAQRRAALLRARRTPRTTAANAKSRTKLAASRSHATRSGVAGKGALSRTRTPKPLPHTASPPRALASAKMPAVAKPSVVAPKLAAFDGSVYALATSGHVVLAATSQGLRSSPDDGATWTPGGPSDSADWRYLAAAKTNAVAASMNSVDFSSDSGATWVRIPLPESITRVSAVTVEPSGAIWVGAREGVFLSADAGITWTTPKNLYVNSVTSLFYDELTDRVTVTTNGSYSGVVFTVQLPGQQVTYAESGWTLRFARPVGDHLVAATLFDGIVVQPRVIAAPASAQESASR